MIGGNRMFHLDAAVWRERPWNRATGDAIGRDVRSAAEVRQHRLAAPWVGGLAPVSGAVRVERVGLPG